MTPKDGDKDFPSIGYKCIEICNELASKGLAFKFNLTFGTTGIKAHPAQLPRRKSKSPGAIKRDSCLSTVVGRQREPSITSVSTFEGGSASTLCAGEEERFCCCEEVE